MAPIQKAAETGRASSRLCTALRKSLCSGRILPGEFMPSVRQLGEEHGVATKTVQRALRHLAEEGLIVAEPRLGYRVTARVNASAARCPLALVLPSEQPQWDALLRMLVEKLQLACTARGCSLLAVGMGHSGPEEVVGQLLAARARAALLNVPNPELIALLGKAGIPVLLVENWLPGAGIDVIAQDSFGGAVLAAKHVACHGRGAIAWLGYPAEAAGLHVIERTSGAMGGLAWAGKSVPADLRVEVPFDDADAAAGAARRLLSGPRRPGAILALWQPLARAVAEAARALGLVPGGDFDMVGWWTEEDYEDGYLPIFAGGPTPPVVVWSLAHMADNAVARMEERRAHAELPPICVRIPTCLRLAGENRKGA
ncbi:MAG TPA: GntR family transcriptional regulator [Planctomycetota bacterium]|nr:GntR family transcriptional regulator [Planctomycetota bacterium]